MYHRSKTYITLILKYLFRDQYYYKTKITTYKKQEAQQRIRKEKYKQTQKKHDSDYKGKSTKLYLHHFYDYKLERLLLFFTHILMLKYLIYSYFF